MSHWTDADVEASVAGTERPEPDREVGDLAKLRRSVSAFWGEYGTRFTAWWRALSRTDRRRLLRVVAPHMPVSLDAPQSTTGVNVSGALALCPEMNLRDLVDSPGALPALYALRGASVGDAAWSAETEDVDAVRLLRRTGLCGAQPAGYRGRTTELYVRLPQTDGPPTVYAVVPGHEATVRASAAAKAGYVLDADLWAAVQSRQAVIYSTLAALADEYRIEVEADTTAHAVTAPLWVGRGVDVDALDGAALDALWADEVRRLADMANVRHATLGRRRERGGGFAATASGFSAASASGSRAAPFPADDGRDRAGAALAAATAAKSAGNLHFATGRHRPAVAVYTKGVDVLRRAGQTEVGGLAPEAAALLAVLLANRAASQLLLAADGRPD
ncbi:hypothetical protein BU14_2209s0001, partial [Porphyra umbilicalis]